MHEQTRVEKGEQTLKENHGRGWIVPKTVPRLKVIHLLASRVHRIQYDPVSRHYVIYRWTPVLVGLGNRREPLCVSTVDLGPSGSVGTVTVRLVVS